jgi:uncharacterized RmlC-like cupin family protein
MSQDHEHPHYRAEHEAAEASHQIDWREHGVKVIRGDQLDTNTAQTPGMNASTDDPLECVLVRSDNEAVVVNLNIDAVEQPETVYWVDPIHKHPHDH